MSIGIWVITSMEFLTLLEWIQTIFWVNIIIITKLYWYNNAIFCLQIDQIRIISLIFMTHIYKLQNADPMTQIFVHNASLGEWHVCYSKVHNVFSQLLTPDRTGKRAKKYKHTFIRIQHSSFVLLSNMWLP